MRDRAKLSISLTFSAFTLCLSGTVHAAPQQLYGKSVIITWTEERQQKPLGESEIRAVGAAGELDLYVSEQGRNFSRMRFTVPNARGRLKSGSRDQVSGENKARHFNFSGTTLNVGMPRGQGGATQVVVNFDSGFQSCTARVIVGKTPGADRMVARSLITRMPVEIYSAKAGGENCRVQSGNVFGN
ncbi:hypothetical protein [Bradyrhizobium sp. 2TAF24]|uniref:hypothetical protein n=1 Tax=Bradyrhizobium sp. 2TAF24 TaxID=3233011 RepID=UPI003F9261A4